MGYAFDGVDSAIQAETDLIGTPVNTGGTATLAGILGNPSNTSFATNLAKIGTVANTGGTATIGAILGDFANTTLHKRIPKYFSATTTLIVSNTTGSIVIGTLTGAIQVVSLQGTVTTVLSSNITAAHLRMNDQTNTPSVTLASGTALSAATAGSLLTKTLKADVAIVLADASQTRVTEPADTILSTKDNIPAFWLTAKNGATTTLDFRYTTTNTPSTGAILWEIWYYPINGGALA
jgi:hypothetical protein